MSHYCLSHSTVPVAAVPAQDAEGVPTRSDEIVLGLDDSPSGRRGTDLGRRARANLGPTPTGHPPPRLAQGLRPQALSGAAGALSHARAGRSASTGPASPTCTKRVDPEPGWLLQFAEGHPGKVLVEQSTSSALLVVGTQEQAGLGRLLLGSVSHYALNHANCPVVAVPAAFASSPPTSDVRTTSS